MNQTTATPADFLPSAEHITERLGNDEIIGFRGDGKAGGGLVLAMQAVASAVQMTGQCEVQDWPFFSSARKGANVRAFMRVGRGPIEIACQVTRPTVAILLNEATAIDVDFASGTSGGIYVVNTEATPEEAAQRYRLTGTVVTVDGNRLGQEHLGHPIPNVSVAAAILRATGIAGLAEAGEALLKMGRKRGFPQRILTANTTCLGVSWEELQFGEFDEASDKDHRLPEFHGYGEVPLGAQSQLRTGLGNRTALFARTGRRLSFADPEDACTGCTLCIGACPEGIILFEPDERRGTKVTGADVGQFCKLCRECIEICPQNLFDEIAFQEDVR